ncbi:hypothetical protein [Corynebacterium bovis]|uniref:hypothetical protein n=2 Tax=Corynebacterium bovis TaxID=36808 RepID=UPI00264F42DA|nr:hypothetical protein [Corynebacterium bovis]MDN8580141.1 hypothetical protein [Corynebacterium bovis]
MTDATMTSTTRTTRATRTRRILAGTGAAAALALGLGGVAGGAVAGAETPAADPAPAVVEAPAAQAVDDAAPAVDPASLPTADEAAGTTGVTVDGLLKPGGYLAVTAAPGGDDAHAHVTTNFGVEGELLPAADAAVLTGELTLPTSIGAPDDGGDVYRVTVTTDSGLTGTAEVPTGSNAEAQAPTA